MPTGTLAGGWGTPGEGSLDITSERNILAGFGSINQLTVFTNALLDGAARDSTNSLTNVCRSGLVLGRKTSTGSYLQYSASATDGTQVAVGVLAVEVLAQDFSASNADRVVPIIISGFLKAGQLIGLDANARSQLFRQFLFDDDLGGRSSPSGNLGITAKTTAYTVVAGDNGKTFVTTGASGAVAFTLPAIAAGLSFLFINTVEQTMSVASAEGTNVVMPGFTAAAGGTTASFATVAQKSGGALRVFSPDGTNWYVFTQSINPLTTA